MQSLQRRLVSILQVRKMNQPSLVILQNVSTVETRSVRLACLLNDISVVNCSLDGLDMYSTDLKNGRALPVGSVEFVRNAMHVAGIAEPENLSYQEAIQRFLGRKIHRIRAGHVLGKWFVKPVATKLFTGFVFDSSLEKTAYSLADQVSLASFSRVPSDTPVWICEPVNFVCEWRYYVQDGAVIGSARYDPDGSDNAPEPHQEVVFECIAASGIDTPFAADFGVLDDGRTVLVELNDFWALGLYEGAITPSQYMKALHKRWSSLFCTG